MALTSLMSPLNTTSSALSRSIFSFISSWMASASCAACRWTGAGFSGADTWRGRGTGHPGPSEPGHSMSLQAGCLRARERCQGPHLPCLLPTAPHRPLQTLPRQSFMARKNPWQTAREKEQVKVRRGSSPLSFEIANIRHLSQ